jgi:hypothetical protein
MLDRYTIHAALESDLPSATATITFIPKRWTRREFLAASWAIPSATRCARAWGACAAGPWCSGRRWCCFWPREPQVQG